MGRHRYLRAGLLRAALAAALVLAAASALQGAAAEGAVGRAWRGLAWPRGRGGRGLLAGADIEDVDGVQEDELGGRFGSSSSSSSSAAGKAPPAQAAAKTAKVEKAKKKDQVQEDALGAGAAATTGKSEFTPSRAQQQQQQQQQPPPAPPAMPKARRTGAKKGPLGGAPGGQTSGAADDRDEAVASGEADVVAAPLKKGKAKKKAAPEKPQPKAEFAEAELGEADDSGALGEQDSPAGSGRKQGPAAGAAAAKPAGREEAEEEVLGEDEAFQPPRARSKKGKAAKAADREDAEEEAPGEDEAFQPPRARPKKGKAAKAKKKRKAAKAKAGKDDFVHERVVDDPEEEEGAGPADPHDILPAEEDLGREQLAASRDGGKGTAGCKIFVLDVNEMGQFLGFPTCDTARLATDPEFGTLLPNATHLRPKFNFTPPMQQYHSMYPFHALPHEQSLNAGPWYLTETLLRSPLRTDDIDEADVIFVNDYCRLMWALSEDLGSQHWWARNNLKMSGTGGLALMSAYNVMMQMMQWKQGNGKEFVFFQSHPGFTLGDENTTREFYDSVVCQTMGDSLHLVVERSQRWKCPTYKEGKFVIVPYSGSPDARAITELPPEEALKKPKDRKTLVFFRGNCGPWESVAKRFRHALVGALRVVGNASDVSACCLGEPKAAALKCTKEEDHGGGTSQGWHKRMLASMADSRFCMIVPGDTQSTERISDAFATGCIPVFVGAPFHAMPLAAHVDYAASTLFINLTDTRRWFGKEKPQWWLNPKQGGKHKGKLGDWWHPKWWTADALGVEPITLKNVEQVVHFLRDMAPETADELYENVLRQRNLFVYNREPRSPPSASDVIIDSMCQYAMEGYGESGFPLNKFRETEESIERARKRRLEAEKRAKEKEAELDSER